MLSTLIKLLPSTFQCAASLKWKKQKYLWEGSVSLVALLLSHVLHTSMEILNCPWIVDGEGNYLPVSVGVSCMHMYFVPAQFEWVMFIFYFSNLDILFMYKMCDV